MLPMNNPTSVNQDFGRATDFPSLLRLLESGDQPAADAMVSAVYPQLCQTIRRRIAPRFRAKFDEEDILQSVFRSFFIRNRNNEFNLLGWESLWSILFLMASRKVGRRVQHFSTQKRDCRRELSANDVCLTDVDGHSSFVAEYSEALQLVFKNLVGRDRQVLDMHLSFRTVPEISHQLGIAERTVHRVLSNIRSKLHDLLDLP